MRNADLTGSLMLGIDIGTSSTKAVLIDLEGKLFASAHRSYGHFSTAPGVAEQDPDDWWQAVCSVTQELLASNSGAASALAAVGISGQGVAMVPLDTNARHLRNAMLWMDTRSSKIASELASSHGERIASISGKLPAAYNFETKLLWLRQNEPDLWNRIWKVVTTTSYINLRLAGCAVMNHSDAGILLSYDLADRCWSEEVMSYLDLDRAIFCDLAACHKVIGSVTAEAARESGLPHGLPVVAGGEDTSCAGLAMGVISEHKAQLSMGSASTIYIPFAHPIRDPRLLAFPHVLEGLTLAGGSMAAGGLAVSWLMDLLHASNQTAEDRDRQLNQFTMTASGVASGANGLIFLPYLAGELQPINDGFARGVFFGLTSGTTRDELFRSVIEGTAYAIEHNLEIARQCGATSRELIAVGGPARNDLWSQTIADVTGISVRVMEDRGGAALGSAILAGMGAGLFTSPMDIQRIHARVRKVFEPASKSYSTYRHLFSVYKELYLRTKDLFPLVAGDNWSTLR